MSTCLPHFRDIRKTFCRLKARLPAELADKFTLDWWNTFPSLFPGSL